MEVICILNTGIIIASINLRVMNHENRDSNL